MLPVKLKQKHFCEFRLARAESTGSGKRSTDAERKMLRISPLCRIIYIMQLNSMKKRNKVEEFRSAG